jgi:hypothetical protein
MSKPTIRKSLAIAALGLAGVAATGAAHAGGVSWSVGIHLPPLVISGGNVGFYPAPVYYPPPVVYAPPPRVVYAPPPVIYRPAPPVVYRPAPVRYDPQYRYGHDGRWNGRGDSDRWRDRDRDGVPNKWDRRD